MKSYDLSNISVLIVEKHSHMRTILRQVLRQFGVPNVFDAADPDIGFQRYKDCYPDIVMVDWGPDFDGLALVSKIRLGNDAGNPWVPMIMCTANTEKRFIVEARDAGATEYLLKPVSAKKIYDRIVSVVDDARSFVRTESFIGPDRRRRNQPYGGEERRKENLAIKITKKNVEGGAEETKPTTTPAGKKKKKKTTEKSAKAPEPVAAGAETEAATPEISEPAAAGAPAEQAGQDGDGKPEA